MNPSSDNGRRLGALFHYGTRLRPVRDWLLILSVTAVLLGASIGWNTLTFVRLTHGETLEVTTPTIDSSAQDSVEKIRGIFTKRAIEERRYQEEYHFIDPSH